MKLTVIHSHQERCGVREYGRQLDTSLRALGVDIKPHSYADLSVALENTPEHGTWLVHFEQGLAHPAYLNEYLRAAHGKKIRTVFCCHWYESVYMTEHYNHGFVDRFVLHRNGYGQTLPGSVIIPLGCPTYEPKRSKAAIRKKLGLPADKIVLTTIGFLTRWKMMPELAHAMLTATASHPELHLHLHTPWPFHNLDARSEEPRIRSVIDNHKADDRITFSTEFLPEEDALDVAYAADLGFVYHCIHTHSVSAATKQFVSAQRPLVVTGSSHAMDMQGGIVRVPSLDVNAFASSVVEVALNRAGLKTLQEQMATEYERMNMDTVARQYVELLRSLP